MCVCLDIGRMMFDVDDMNDEVYADLYPVDCSDSMVVTIFCSVCMRCSLRAC
jgi:hypothetical protein